MPKTLAEMTTIAGPSGRRFGVLGAAGTGKTWFARTFPKVTFGNCDDKLCTGDKTVDLTKPNIQQELGIQQGPNLQLAVIRFLQRYLRDFGPDETFVLDGISAIEHSWHAQARNNPLPFMSKGDPAKGRPPEFDGFKFFREWKGYLCALFELLSYARCQVVVTMHEAPERDDKGNPTARVKQLLDGSFVDQLPGKFTFFTRTLKSAGTDPKTGQFVHKMQVRPSQVFTGTILPPGFVATTDLIDPTYDALMALEVQKQ